ncbi:hypothetical protein PsorP6_017540 [Peronosclerospora sorghi]|uniref:Uncharacterized protein n=1 Tax=Peronosclerospora sorghi TaxID=230839 RepID=A0ACC0WLE3_9STRA|nr:hypothetical protein PsorP6_017540 [Peronosclerospora sorghi]
MQVSIDSACKLSKRKGRLDSTISAVFFAETLHQMFLFTIGDCKCVVFRNGNLVFESDSIIYDFNVPAVVSSNQSINYVEEVQMQAFEYEGGDVCLLFSDGVHDNLIGNDGRLTNEQVLEKLLFHKDYSVSSVVMILNARIMDSELNMRNLANDFESRLLGRMLQETWTPSQVFTELNLNKIKDKTRIFENPAFITWM